MQSKPVKNDQLCSLMAFKAWKKDRLERLFCSNWPIYCNSKTAYNRLCFNRLCIDNLLNNKEESVYGVHSNKELEEQIAQLFEPQPEYESDEEVEVSSKIPLNLLRKDPRGLCCDRFTRDWGEFCDKPVALPTSSRIAD